MHDERLKFSYGGRTLRSLSPLSAARYRRLLAGIRIQDLASASGCSTREISEFERNLRPLDPETSERLRLATEALESARLKSARRNGEAARS